jgi:hypothetical protein
MSGVKRLLGSTMGDVRPLVSEQNEFNFPPPEGKILVKDKDGKERYVDNEYCDIEVEQERKTKYDRAQSYIDKLVKSENISYDCDFHKHFLRQMLIGDLCTMWEQQMSSRLPNGIDPRDVYKFLKSRYDI